MGQTGDECWQLEKAIQMEFNAILIELHCNVFAALSHSLSIFLDSFAFNLALLLYLYL